MAADLSSGWKMDSKGFLIPTNSLVAPTEAPATVWGWHAVSGSIGEWAHNKLVDLASSTPSKCYRTIEGAKAGALAQVDADWEDMKEFWEENDSPGHDGTLDWHEVGTAGAFLRAEDYCGNEIWVYQMTLL